MWVGGYFVFSFPKGKGFKKSEWRVPADACLCQVPATIIALQAERSEWQGAAPPWLEVCCSGVALGVSWLPVAPGLEQLYLELLDVSWEQRTAFSSQVPASTPKLSKLPAFGAVKEIRTSFLTFRYVSLEI